MTCWSGPDTAVRPQPKRHGVVRQLAGGGVGDIARLETWAASAARSAALPTLPLWLADDLSVPLKLEASYEETCASSAVPSFASTVRRGLTRRSPRFTLAARSRSNLRITKGPDPAAGRRADRRHLTAHT